MLFIVVGAALIVGGRVDAQYTASGGFFPNGALGPIKAISFALFSFLGIEMVAISSGEARGQREIARATRIVFALLTFVYIGAIAILVGVMPWQAAGVRQSPFVTVFEVAGIPAASTLMNVVVLSAALSGANASLYVSSRTLFSLARGGYAPPRSDSSPPRGRRAMRSRLGDGHSRRHGGAEIRAGIGLPLHHRRVAVRRNARVVGRARGPVRFRARLSREDVARMPMRSPGGALASRIGFVVLAFRDCLDLVGRSVADHDCQRRPLPARPDRGVLAYDPPAAAGSVTLRRSRFYVRGSVTRGTDSIERVMDTAA